MNENIDLTKILKHCPKGTKLYSPIFGELDFEEIRSDEEYSIFLRTGVNGTTFTKEGFYYADKSEECLLFPSKDQRDWSKFTASWLKKEKFNPKTLKPFDKVLVRDKYSFQWTCTFYSYTREDTNILKYATINTVYEYCIPYNDDTKHLVGTTNEAPKFYRYWEN